MFVLKSFIFYSLYVVILGACVLAILIQHSHSVSADTTAGVPQNTEESAWADPAQQISICHVDGTTYQQERVSLQALVEGTDDHGADDTDIIPSFWYTLTASGTPELFQGKNWTTDTQQVYENNCRSVATVTIKKEVSSDAGTAVLFHFSSNIPDDHAELDLLGGTHHQYLEVPLGEYTITETALPEGWEFEDAICTPSATVTDASVTFTITGSEHVVCTFTNTEVSTEPLATSTSTSTEEAEVATSSEQIATSSEAVPQDTEESVGTFEETYRISGYVWHDSDHNGNLGANEDRLGGWEVQATDGSTTYSTTSDATGYYYFDVPAGTWTISETVLSHWVQAYPSVSEAGGVHVVSLPSIESEEVALFFPFNLFIPVAHAQAAPSQNFNFGNIYVGCSDVCVSERSGGGKKIEMYDPDWEDAADTETQDVSTPEEVDSHTDGLVLGDTTTRDPIPQVLAEQVSAVPTSAPNTGGGGTAPAPITSVVAVGCMMGALLVFSRMRRFDA